MYITKERKLHPSYRCHDNSYATGPVLIETKIPRFKLKQGSSTPNNLKERIKTIWEPCVFGARPSVPLLMVANGAIWFFTEEDWSQECYHGNNRFEEHCSDIVDSGFNCLSGTIYDGITFLDCIIQKCEYL